MSAVGAATFTKCTIDITLGDTNTIADQTGGCQDAYTFDLADDFQLDSNSFTVRIGYNFTTASSNEEATTFYNTAKTSMATTPSWADYTVYDAE